MDDTEEDFVEYIRQGIRDSIQNERKASRISELNKNRVVFGDTSTQKELLNPDEMMHLGKLLQKKPLPLNSYVQLQNALLQNEDNIRGFLSIPNMIPCLIRDMSSRDPKIQLIAVHCCCNIAVGSKKQCHTLAKYLLPHLLGQLDTMSVPMLEGYIWIIGNLAGGNKHVVKTLCFEGCVNHLIRLLDNCDETILEAIIYALTHCLHQGFEFISEAESVQMTNSLIKRKCYTNKSGIWILALLSSVVLCDEVFFGILEDVYRIIVDNLEKLNEGRRKKSYGVEKISGAVRILANVVPETSGYAGRLFLSDENIGIILNTLLQCPYTHLKKETLWLIGNLCNHTQPDISNKINDLLPHISGLQLAIYSVNK